MFWRRFAFIVFFSITASACFGGGGGGGGSSGTDTRNENEDATVPQQPQFYHSFARTNENGVAHFAAAYPIFESGKTDLVIAPNFYPNSEAPENGEDDPFYIKAIDNSASVVTEITASNGGTTHAREIVFGDFNGDQLTDVFIADHGWDAVPFPGNENQLLLQENGALVDASDRLPQEDNFTHAASVADINGDGFDDVFLVNEQDALLLGAASGTFERVFLPDALSDVSQRDYLSVHIADLDGDGEKEVILGANRIGSRSNDTVFVLAYDTASKTFSLDDSFGSCVLDDECHANDVKTADFNSDGLIDIVTLENRADYAAGILPTIYFQNSQGEFVASTTSFPNFDTSREWTQFVYPLDWDCDEDIDLVLNANEMDSRNVYLNDGNGTFSLLEISSNWFEGISYDFSWLETVIDPISKRIFRVGKEPDKVWVELFAQGQECN